jgi:adenylate cyclase
MIHVHVFNPSQNESFDIASDVLEIGRGPRLEGACERIVVQDAYTSRDQVRIELQADGQVKLSNIGRAPVQFPDGSKIVEKEQRKVALPLRIFVGQTTIDLGSAAIVREPDTAFATIQRPVSPASNPAQAASIDQLRGSPTSEKLTQWFETLLLVQRAAAGSLRFYEDTSKAVVDLIGLDRGMVLLSENGQWRIAAQHSKVGDNRTLYSERIVRRVIQDRRTFFQNLSLDEGSHSLQGVESVVASPVMNDRSEVIGIVYGSRDMRVSGNAMGIDPLEAQLVQILAGIVSAGLARVSQEAEATRMRVQFEQFFSPQLSQALEQDAGLLSARERSLTLLFADLRGFSKIAEKIGPSETYKMLGEILDGFTTTIMEQEGVVIDYYGDGFAAMWNAPVDQPNHAELAARAGLGIKRQMPRLNAELAAPLGVTLAVGIGIHSGTSQVGNSGSKRRLKYGPRGHAVNLTSRVEGATKLVGTSCLVTGATKELLPPSFQVRRICQARLYGMIEPADLFELEEPTDPVAWNRLREQYEQALRELENGNPAACLQGCAKILASDHQIDGPTRWLLTQTNSRLISGDANPPKYFSFDSK